MKKRTWIPLLLIVLCIVGFYVYRSADALSTDRKAPEIVISGDMLQISALAPKSELLQGVTAKDDKDGDVTASVVVENARLVAADGTVEITYAAFDSAGNVAKAVRQVRYTDYKSPRFDLTGPLAFPQSSGASVLSRLTVNDMVDGNITRKLRATSLSADLISGVGIHDVAVRVTNSLGDTVELILPVEIYPAGAYQATLELTDYLVYLTKGERFEPRKYLSAYAVGRESTSLAAGVPEHLSLRTLGGVNTKESGVYSVSYTMTDELGLIGYSRLIVIVEE